MGDGSSVSFFVSWLVGLLVGLIGFGFLSLGPLQCTELRLGSWLSLVFRRWLGLAWGFCLCAVAIDVAV